MKHLLAASTSSAYGANTETRVRYGYRRVHVLLRREGWDVNHKRTYRLYREEGLRLRRKVPRQRVKAAGRDDRARPSGPNDVWAMDLMADQAFDGRKLRILTIIDAAIRLCPAVDVRATYHGADFVETLERVTAIHGRPNQIRNDQGTEFTSNDVDLWAWQQGVVTSLGRASRQTKPSPAFNSRVRAELLSANWFLSLADARAKSEAWRREYNTR